MAEFPVCVSASQRELARFTKEERLTAEQKVKERKKAAKVAPKVPANAQTVMRQKMWRQHRERVKEAVSTVDAEAPSFQAARITGVNNLRDEANNFMKRTKANIQLLVEISRTMRTHGAINPFRYEAVHAVSAIPVALLALEKIEQENKDFGRRILEVKSEVDSGLSDKRMLEGRNTAQPPPMELPAQAMAKYDAFNIQLPESDAELRRLFRPRIYFDLYLKDARPLGRIIVQLYTEAAPLVVLQLIRSCMCNQHNKFHVKRLFPNLWLEVDLELCPDSLLSQPLEYDAKVIDHGASSYVLSFSKAYVKGFNQHLSFAISFKPLNVVNGSRVGFGRIVKGSKICDCIQSYGTKNGKLSRGLLFTSCGLL